MNEGWTIRQSPDPLNAEMVRLNARKGSWVVHVRIRADLVSMVDLDVVWRSGLPAHLARTTQALISLPTQVDELLDTLERLRAAFGRPGLPLRLLGILAASCWAAMLLVLVVFFPNDNRALAFVPYALLIAAVVVTALAARKAWRWL